MMKGPGRAFSQPALFYETIDESNLLQKWLTHSATLDEWRETFLVAAMVQESTGVVSGAAFEAEEEFVVKARVMKTPSKRRRGNREDLEVNFTPHKQLIKDPLDVKLQDTTLTSVGGEIKQSLIRTDLMLVSTVDRY